LPGEKDPTQAICTCPHCNSCVDQKTHVCQNCQKVIVPNQGQPHPRKVPQKGERYEDYGPKLDYITQLASRRGNKDKDLAEHSDDTVKDEFSVDVKMCRHPKRNNMRNVDVTKEEVMRSCTDLAIDG
jgi:hypothetical protein